MARRIQQFHQIHLAILQNNLERVRTLIHRNRALVKKQDPYQGATPLMLAALIGSAKLVTFLLEKGASWDTKDRYGYVAAKYVQGKYADKMQVRYRRLVNRNSKSLRQRGDLHAHLKDVAVLETQYKTRPSGTLSFQRRGRSLRISKLVAKVRLAGPISRNATCACIAPGSTIKPMMCAISGWTAFKSPGILDRSEYTQVVRDMAKILEFPLPGHCYDSPRYDPTPGPHNKGRFNAAHCEKLLAAYWVTQQLEYVFGSPDLSRIYELKEIDLPHERRHASLFLDHRPCTPCRNFLGAIQNATGIKVCAFSQALVREVSRDQKSGVCENCTCPKCKRAGGKTMVEASTTFTPRPEKQNQNGLNRDVDTGIESPGVIIPPILQTEPGICYDYGNGTFRRPLHMPIHRNSFADRAGGPHNIRTMAPLRAQREPSAVLEGVFRCQSKERSQEYQVITSSPSLHPDMASEGSSVRSHVPLQTSNFHPLQEDQREIGAARKRLKEVANSLQLRDRFAYEGASRSQIPKTRPPTPRRIEKRRPGGRRKSGGSKHIQPHNARTSARAGPQGRPPKKTEQVTMRARSTLIANARFRKEGTNKPRIGFAGVI